MRACAMAQGKSFLLDQLTRAPAPTDQPCPSVESWFTRSTNA